jgi:hypothetical protein
MRGPPGSGPPGSELVFVVREYYDGPSVTEHIVKVPQRIKGCENTPI